MPAAYEFTGFESTPRSGFVQPLAQAEPQRQNTGPPLQCISSSAAQARRFTVGPGLARTLALSNKETPLSNIYIPATSADQWAQFLAEPVKQWRTGFSARTLAYSWQEAAGFPVEVQSALSENGAFAEIKLLLALPEHQVHLPGGSRPSQNDIWVLARAGESLVSIAVEGKVAEPFGPTLEEWLDGASAGKSARLAYLRGELGLAEQLPGTVRYQLLHRFASAVIEAKRFGATHAVMLVHSFSQAHQWFEDYAAFAALLGVEVAVNRVVSVGQRGGVHLHLGWVCGDAKYLSK